ncbi:MAG: hypothetical protein IID08_05770 [Candidatus Hydrogenedentes bacterium]|nr:hypothetical protein [Candidatus Hydrogenedentota bacterium]
MDTISASAETLMRQAGMTAAEYFGVAIRRIDDRFGDGYSESHPELVGAFMQTAAYDLAAAVVTSAIQELAEAQR